jgi:Kef-type K+ transport system membrane component KefB
VKALVTLSVMSVMGKKLLDPIFYFVAKSSSHEAFLSIILTTVLLMSFVTQGLILNPSTVLPIIHTTSTASTHSS